MTFTPGQSVWYSMAGRTGPRRFAATVVKVRDNGWVLIEVEGGAPRPVRADRLSAR